MNQIVNREEFLAKLQLTLPGLAIKPLVEQSASYVFRDGNIFTFNNQILCKIASGLDDTFKSAVPAKPLLDLISNLPEDEIELEEEEGELIISGIKRSSGIKREKEIFLPVEAVDTPKEWWELHPEFSSAIEIVSSCASKENTRFNMNHIHLHPQYLEACDNHQMARYNLESGFYEETLIPRESAEHIPPYGMTAFAETDGWLHFRNAKGLYFACRRHIQKYPDLNKVTSIDGEPAILPGGLADATKIASIFSKQTAEGDDRLLVTIKTGMLQIKGQGVHGWYLQKIEFKYKGPDMSFIMSPKILIELSKQNNECIIAPERLKVDGGKFIYIALLKAPPQKQQEKQR